MRALTPQSAQIIPLSGPTLKPCDRLLIAVSKFPLSLLLTLQSRLVRIPGMSQTQRIALAYPLRPPGFVLSLRLNEWHVILMENTGVKGKRRKPV